MSTIHMVAYGMAEIDSIDSHTFQCIRIQIRKELQPYKLRLTQQSHNHFTLRRILNRHRSEKVYGGNLQDVCIAALCTIEPDKGWKPPPETTGTGRYERNITATQLREQQRAWYTEAAKVSDQIMLDAVDAMQKQLNKALAIPPGNPKR